MLTQIQPQTLSVTKNRSITCNAVYRQKLLKFRGCQFSPTPATIANFGGQRKNLNF